MHISYRFIEKEVEGFNQLNRTFLRQPLNSRTVGFKKGDNFSAKKGLRDIERSVRQNSMFFFYLLFSIKKVWSASKFFVHLSAVSSTTIRLSCLFNKHSLYIPSFNQTFVCLSSTSKVGIVSQSKITVDSLVP